jgi:hypothetical protein
VIARPVIVLLVALGAGCRHSSPPPQRIIEAPIQPPPPVEPPWVGTLALVQTAVDSGQFAKADSMLADFERDQAGTADASESSFWRAMLRADPRNPAFAPADARAALESYLGSEGARRRTEASVMLRMLSISDSLRAALAAQRTAAESRDRARDEELQKLRDELQRTQAELDRIKRRLGPPKP